jgi:hypothetical protein
MRSRRTLLALLGGVLAFAVVVGMAASLGGINSDDLGADDSVVASCDTNGVTSSYTTVYNTTTTAGFKVDDVTIGGIDDACDGQSMTITLTGAANASLGTVTQAVPVNAAFTNVVDFVAQNVLAESVTGIHVVITG